MTPSYVDPFFYCFHFCLWMDLLASSGQHIVRNAAERPPRSMSWGEGHTDVLPPNPLGVMWKGLHACGGLDKNGSSKLIYLNIWFPVNGSVWRRMGVVL